MKTYIVEFTGVKTYWAFYEALIKGLELPDWCGRNPDAIWDMLTGFMGGPATIYLQGTSMLPKNLSIEMNIIQQVFQDLLEEYYDEGFIVKFVS